MEIKSTNFSYFHVVMMISTKTVVTKYVTLEMFKVARVVNSKLAFMDWSFYNLIILIMLCKIRCLNYNKALLISEIKLFVWKIENFDKLQLPQGLIFFLKVFHTFPTGQFLQNSVRIFFIMFRSLVINKTIKKNA